MMIIMGWPLGWGLYDANCYTWFGLLMSMSFKHDTLDKFEKKKSMIIITNPLLT